MKIECRLFLLPRNVHAHVSFTVFFLVRSMVNRFDIAYVLPASEADN